MPNKRYFVYIMSNHTNTVLYTGITNDLAKRAYEHKSKLVKGFTQKYNVTKLVYYEQFNTPLTAIEREKTIKGGSRRKKVELIHKTNAMFDDLYNFL